MSSNQPNKDWLPQGFVRWWRRALPLSSSWNISEAANSAVTGHKQKVRAGFYQGGQWSSQCQIFSAVNNSTNNSLFLEPVTSSFYSKLNVLNWPTSSNIFVQSLSMSKRWVWTKKTLHGSIKLVQLDPSLWKPQDHKLILKHTILHPLNSFFLYKWEHVY